MIYLDLDNTLAYTCAASFHTKKSKTKILAVGGEIYQTELREFTHGFLYQCRRLGPTKLLTSATRDYALEHNLHLNLGFDPKEIIAREDYQYETYVAYGKQTCLCQTNKDPYGLLIDNLPPTTLQSQLKQKFLGIQPIQYIQIREYNGGEDPVDFQEETKKLIQTIKTHTQQHKPQHERPNRTKISENPRHPSPMRRTQPTGDPNSQSPPSLDYPKT
jgi:hypothetical protein